MLSIKKTFFAIILLLLQLPAFAQDEDQLRTFGSLQLMLFNQEARLEGSGPIVQHYPAKSYTRNTYAVQQMDLFFSKPIGDNFDAFVDLEFQLNYSSSAGWGSLSIQEAWLNYRYEDWLNVKAGLLFPAFNHLNEIKNRLALLPYIFRPFAYERLLSQNFNLDDFVPENAFLQIHGAIPLDRFYLDYALYSGNAEGSYITRRGADGRLDNDVEDDFEFLSGVDPMDMKFKLIGTRIGIRSRNEKMKAGISATRDYNNFRDSIFVSNDPTTNIGALRGDALRYRIGADFLHHIFGFTFEAEYINVFYDYDKADDAGISLAHELTSLMLGYEIIDDLFLYAAYQWGKNEFGQIIKYKVPNAGIAFHLNDAITLKAQYIRYSEEHAFGSNNFKTVISFAFAGCSILL